MQLNIISNGGKVSMKFKKFQRALTVVLEETTYQQIKEISDAGKIAMAEWVRAILRTALGEGNDMKISLIRKPEM